MSHVVRLGDIFLSCISLRKEENVFLHFNISFFPMKYSAVAASHLTEVNSMKSENQFGGRSWLAFHSFRQCFEEWVKHILFQSLWERHSFIFKYNTQKGTWFIRHGEIQSQASTALSNQEVEGENENCKIDDCYILWEMLSFCFADGKMQTHNSC